VEVGQDIVKWRDVACLDLWGCATRGVVSKMDLRGVSFEDGRWVEVGQDIVKCRDVACFYLWILLPDRWSVRWILGE